MYCTGEDSLTWKLLREMRRLFALLFNAWIHWPHQKHTWGDVLYYCNKEDWLGSIFVTAWIFVVFGAPNCYPPLSLRLSLPPLFARCTCAAAAAAAARASNDGNWFFRPRSPWNSLQTESTLQTHRFSSCSRCTRVFSDCRSTCLTHDSKTRTKFWWFFLFVCLFYAQVVSLDKQPILPLLSLLHCQRDFHKSLKRNHASLCGCDLRLWSVR